MLSTRAGTYCWHCADYEQLLTQCQTPSQPDACCGQHTSSHVVHCRTSGIDMYGVQHHLMLGWTQRLLCQCWGCNVMYKQWCSAGTRTQHLETMQMLQFCCSAVEPPLSTLENLLWHFGGVQLAITLKSSCRHVVGHLTNTTTLQCPTSSGCKLRHANLCMKPRSTVLASTQLGSTGCDDTLVRSMGTGIMHWLSCMLVPAAAAAAAACRYIAAAVDDLQCAGPTYTSYRGRPVLRTCQLAFCSYPRRLPDERACCLLTCCPNSMRSLANQAVYTTHIMLPCFQLIHGQFT